MKELTQNLEYLKKTLNKDVDVFARYVGKYLDLEDRQIVELAELVARICKKTRAIGGLETLNSLGTMVGNDVIANLSKKIPDILKDYLGEDSLLSLSGNESEK